MRILRALTGRLLPCGCLVGRYETYGGATLWMVDVVARSCDVPAHGANAIITSVDPAPSPVRVMPSMPQQHS